MGHSDVEGAGVTILSRYIIGRFVQPLAFSAAAFIAIFTVVDVVNRMSSFLDREVGWVVIVRYYAWSIPYFAFVTLPMACLLASLFCMGGLSRTQEISAIKAAGVPLVRIVAPVLVVAFAISVVAMGASRDLIPAANQLRRGIETGQGASPHDRRAQVVVRDVNQQVLSLSAYHPRVREGKRVTLDRYDGLALRAKVRANALVWADSGWVFVSGERRRFEGGREWVVQFDSLRATTLTVLPEDLSRESRPHEELTNSALDELIARRERNGGEVHRARVDLALRMSFSFAGFVMVLFGLPLSTYTHRAGRPLQVGICLLASFAFYGTIQAARAVGWNGIVDPVAAAWVPNGLFLAIGLLLLSRAHT